MCCGIAAVCSAPHTGHCPCTAPHCVPGERVASVRLSSRWWWGGFRLPCGLLSKGGARICPGEVGAGKQGGGFWLGWGLALSKTASPAVCQLQSLPSNRPGSQEPRETFALGENTQIKRQTASPGGLAGTWKAAGNQAEKREISVQWEPGRPGRPSLACFWYLWSEHPVTVM